MIINWSARRSWQTDLGGSTPGIVWSPPPPPLPPAATPASATSAADGAWSPGHTRGKRWRPWTPWPVSITVQGEGGVRLRVGGSAGVAWGNWREDAQDLVAILAGEDALLLALLADAVQEDTPAAYEDVMVLALMRV